MGEPVPLDRIRTNPTALVRDPEDLVSMDWSGEWDPDSPEGALGPAD